MSGFDSLVGRSLATNIVDRLGHETADMIEQRLGEKHGMSLVMAAEDFAMMDKVLKELFGHGAESIRRRLVESMIYMKHDNDAGGKFIIAKDVNLTERILESFGDTDKKKIMNAVFDRPMIISDILEHCGIAQTSGYRKINSLIENGFLVVDGHETKPDGKKVNRYAAIFDDVRIHIEKNNVLVHLQPTRKASKDSIVIKTLHGMSRYVTAE